MSRTRKGRKECKRIIPALSSGHWPSSDVVRCKSFLPFLLPSSYSRDSSRTCPQLGKQTPWDGSARRPRHFHTIVLRVCYTVLLSFAQAHHAYSSHLPRLFRVPNTFIKHERSSTCSFPCQRKSFYTVINRGSFIWLITKLVLQTLTSLFNSTVSWTHLLDSIAFFLEHSLGHQTEGPFHIKQINS